MQYISFGTDAGHLARRVSQLAGSHEVRAGLFRLATLQQPDVLELLWQAADGHWIVEWLRADQEPDTDAGVTVQLRVLSQDFDGRTVLHGMRTDAEGGPVRSALADIERIHVF